MEVVCSQGQSLQCFGHARRMPRVCFFSRTPLFLFSERPMRKQRQVRKVVAASQTSTTPRKSKDSHSRTRSRKKKGEDKKTDAEEHEEHEEEEHEKSDDSLKAWQRSLWCRNGSNSNSYSDSPELDEGGGGSSSSSRRKEDRNEEKTVAGYETLQRSFQNGPLSLTWEPSELVEGESELRIGFLERLMHKARNGDVMGAEAAMLDFNLAGFRPGPRAYHGLVTAYCSAGDSDGALQALKKEIASGLRPFQETFISVARLFGSQGNSSKGEQILEGMQGYNLDPRPAWMILIDELVNAGFLKEANDIFVQGSNESWKATDRIYDMLAEENAKAIDHAGVVTVLEEMEKMGRVPTTFHYNCLLMVEALLGEADIAGFTFESMRYAGDHVSPDTESYNWLIQAYSAAKSGVDRLQEVVELLGEMAEDHARVLPNARTYAIVVECFTKHACVKEALRHFRALQRYPGGLSLLRNEKIESDPLSLFLRSLCLSGRIDDLLEALELLIKENISLSPRAMFVNRKGRSLVSSWIEPIKEEAELGFEVDYIARYIAEGGLTGERKRWSPSIDGQSAPTNPDFEGFAYTSPRPVSFKSFCMSQRRAYSLKLLRKVRQDGKLALGPDVTEEELQKVLQRLRRDAIIEPTKKFKKPKAASKMLVGELKEELEAQGLPIDGTRKVLYQRVQKTRRIKRARGQPLWIPPAEDEKEQVDDRIEVLISRINIKDDHTETWRQRLLDAMEMSGTEGGVTVDDILYPETRHSLDSENDKEEEDEEENVEDETEIEEDGGEGERPEPPALLASQLLNNESELAENDSLEGSWHNLSFQEKVAKLKADKFSVSEMFTIADVWGWTWEREFDSHIPEKWSQEREVKLGIEIAQKVIELGSQPTVGDYGMLLRAALRTPFPEALVHILQQAHKLGYAFGSAIYDEVVSLCLRLDERDAAIAIVSNMEESGISVSDEILDKILPDESE